MKWRLLWRIDQSGTNQTDRGPRSISYRLDFLALLLVLILINCVFWNDSSWLQHDTLGAFQVFYFFYNDWFYHGELPRWIPFGMYGRQSDVLQIMILTPASYFSILVGWLLKVKNVLLVFKLSVFFEQLMLLVGTYLLSRLLYRSRVTAFFVCVGIVTSTVWFIQIFLNLRFYYLLPMILYFFLRFLKEKDISDLWISGIVFVASLFGNAFHFAAMYLFILLIIGVSLVAQGRGAISDVPQFKFRPTAWFLLCVLVLMMLAYLYPVSQVPRYLTSYVIDRSSESFTSNVEQFLIYGRNTGLQKFLGLMYAGPVDIGHPMGLDYTMYVGFLPLLFLVYAIKNVHQPDFRAIGLATLVLVSFSLADASWVARFAYHMSPFMPFYRHIGLIGGLLRLFILLVAGFGLDRYLADVGTRDQLSAAGFNVRRELVIIGVALASVALLFNQLVNRRGDVYAVMWPHFFYYAIALLAIALAILGSRMGRSLKTAKGTILLFFLLDMLVYQGLVFSRVPQVGSQSSEAVRTHPYSFAMSRTDQIQNYSPRSRMARTLFTNSKIVGHDSFFATAYNFFQVDPCTFEPFKIDFLNRDFSRLLTLTRPESWDRVPPDPALLSWLGCDSKKLFLRDQPQMAESESYAEEVIRSAGYPNSLTVLSGGQGIADGDFPPAIAPALADDIKVKLFSANRLRLDVSVSNPRGSWLVYLDAFHPGWHAYVNGTETPIVKANTAFKAVRVPPGTNRVEFLFWDGWLSTCTLVIASLGVCFGFFMFSVSIRALTESA